jgi:hypothetical protein
VHLCLWWEEEEKPQDSVRANPRPGLALPNSPAASARREADFCNDCHAGGNEAMVWVTGRPLPDPYVWA